MPALRCAALPLLLFGACAALPSCTPPRPPDPAKRLLMVAPCPQKPGDGILVVGAVQHPTQLAEQPGLGLIRSIALAGGLTPLAWRRHVVIRRCKSSFVLDAEAILNGEAMDPPLVNGDVVNVTERDE